MKITKYLTFINVRKFLSLAVCAASAPKLIDVHTHPLATLGVVFVAWFVWPSQNDFFALREADQPIEQLNNPPEPPNLHWYLDGADGEIRIVDADNRTVYEEVDLCTIIGVTVEDGYCITNADLRKLLAAATVMVDKHNDALG